MLKVVVDNEQKQEGDATTGTEEVVLTDSLARVMDSWGHYHPANPNEQRSVVRSARSGAAVA
jgi:hypothetical protein